MAQSTKYATLICVIMTILLVVLSFIAYKINKPLLIPLIMIPIAAYEVYRTEGVSTKWASWGVLAGIIIEAILVVGGIKINISKIISLVYPLDANIDLSAAIPVLIALCAIMLVKKTAGIYTKWLAVLIIAGAAVLFYLIDPSMFGSILSSGVKEGIDKLKTQ